MTDDQREAVAALKTDRHTMSDKLKVLDAKLTSLCVELEALPGEQKENNAALAEVKTQLEQIEKLIQVATIGNMVKLQPTFVLLMARQQELDDKHSSLNLRSQSIRGEMEETKNASIELWDSRQHINEAILALGGDIGD